MSRFIALMFVCLATFASAQEKRPCIFCEIVKGQSPASQVYRDARVMAFMDIAPKNPGHVLVVPVEHSENLLDLPNETAKEMMGVAQRIVLAIKKTDIKADAFQLRVNSGSLVQGIKHAHLHVVPRFHGDGGDRAEESTPKAPREELDALAKKIRAALEQKDAPAAPGK